MYILLSPATGADITARTGTANQPVTARIAAGVPARGRAENPVTSWGAFHYEDPTAEQLADPSFIPQILRADRVSAANLAAYVREVERRAERSSDRRLVTSHPCYCGAGCACTSATICGSCSVFCGPQPRIPAALSAMKPSWTSRNSPRL